MSNTLDTSKEIWGRQIFKINKDIIREKFNEKHKKVGKGKEESSQDVSPMDSEYRERRVQTAREEEENG